MKVLFINSGNSKDFDIPPFIKIQGISLSEKGAKVDYFKIQGRSIKGYINTVYRLRKYLKENSFDLIHAHYNLSGWVAVLAFPKIPIVLSLMGTDAYGEYIGINKIIFKSRFMTVLTYMIQPFVNAIISKSKQIESYVYRKKISYVIPNGISLEFFKRYPPEIREELDLKKDKNYVLFLGDVNYKRKNFELAKNAVKLLGNKEVELISPYPVSHEKVVKYLYAADIFIMTAFIEGSSNVIKEAMACNCPIVSTDAGDAKWVIGDTPGCFITSFDPADVADKLQMALDFAQNNKRTNGRERIIELGLDSETIAGRIVGVYNKVLANSK